MSSFGFGGVIALIGIARGETWENQRYPATYRLGPGGTYIVELDMGESTGVAVELKQYFLSEDMQWRPHVCDWVAVDAPAAVFEIGRECKGCGRKQVAEWRDEKGASNQ